MMTTNKSLRQCSWLASISGKHILLVTQEVQQALRAVPYNFNVNDGFGAMPFDFSKLVHEQFSSAGFPDAVDPVGAQPRGTAAIKSLLTSVCIGEMSVCLRGKHVMNEDI